MAPHHLQEWMLRPPASHETHSKPPSQARTSTAKCFRTRTAPGPRRSLVTVSLERGFKGQALIWLRLWRCGPLRCTARWSVWSVTQSLQRRPARRLDLDLSIANYVKLAMARCLVGDRARWDSPLEELAVLVMDFPSFFFFWFELSFFFGPSFYGFLPLVGFFFFYLSHGYWIWSFGCVFFFGKGFMDRSMMVG